MTFDELNDELEAEVECDIAAICVLAKQQMAAVRRRQANALRTAERALSRSPGVTADADQAALHAEARQRYATLLSLFTLLKQRSDIEGRSSRDRRGGGGNARRGRLAADPAAA